MGYLHQGHLSLVTKAKSVSDVSVVSIFVNPSQFSPEEDLKTYPRNFERDEDLLMKLGVDAVFYPDESEIYPPDFQTYVTVDHLSKLWEGRSRPAHFRGVATIVNKLFNIIKPHAAVFGQKDAQQAEIIKRMVKDLDMDIEIIINPIVRESDGLAMSSRNVYLNLDERKDALVLFEALQKAETLIKEGEVDCSLIINRMNMILRSASSARPDYAAIVNEKNFESTEILEKGNKYYILIACYIGKTRLIDNFLVDC